jgi:arylsulfatase A-like enzyme
MNRLRTIRLALTLCVAAAGVGDRGTASDAARADPHGRPNVLLIFTDDESYRTLSCYRAEGAWPWVRTPHIDRLAKEGVRFTDMYGAAWCTPSRACLLTGLLPHGIRGVHINSVLDGRIDPHVCRFWPAELRKGGYQTAMIGKWHVGHDAGHGRVWDHSVVWDQADIKGDWYNDQILSIDGAPKHVVPGYSTDVYTRFATDYIRQDHKQPWFLWLCYNAPHLPTTFAPRHRNTYANVDVPIPADIFGPRPDKPAYMHEYTQWKRGKGGNAAPLFQKQPLPQVVRDYNRLVCALDEGVGHVLEALEQTGQLERTLILFTSDQGFAWGEHGFAWKVGPYDACLRMPLLVRLPGRVAQGAVCRRPVTVVDLPPTILGATGTPLPWKMHGHDLEPLLKNPQADWDHPAVMENFRWDFGPQTDRGVTGDAYMGGIPWWIFLRNGRHKYVRTLVPDEIEELYDLVADPYELRNLAQEPGQRELLERFREQLRTELTRTQAGLVDHLPAPRGSTP